MVKINYYLKRPLEKFAYSLIKSYYKSKMKRFFEPRIIGQENLPLRDSVIIVPNHQMGIDGILLSICLDRQIHFLIQKEGVYDSRMKLGLWASGGIPVDTSKYDSLTSLDTANFETIKQIEKQKVIEKIKILKITSSRASNYLHYCSDFIGVFSEGPARTLKNQLTGKIIPVDKRKHEVTAAHLAIKNERGIVPIGIRVADEINRIFWEFPLERGGTKLCQLENYVLSNGKIPYVINIGKPIYGPSYKKEFTERVRTEVIKLYNLAEKELK